MEKLQFSIEIKAPREKVWKVLWEDATYRDWANIIDEGQYVVGDWSEGGKIQFLYPSGSGVSSVIEKLVPNEFVSFRNAADIENWKEQPLAEKSEEWSGGTESYSLKEEDGVTTLTVAFDVPQAHKDEFEDKFPKALQRVKMLSER
ncbi:MAG: SRPBCC domain-containing protein [Euryarchaeota archaeon]|nr:SRPBCC domain-containing protein [Euryarchaeota archaeon]